MTVEAQDIAYGVFGTGAIGIALRIIITWLGKQGLTQTSDKSQKGLIEDLREEAKKWQERYDSAVKDHAMAEQQYAATLMLLGATQNQNKMLRMLLIQRGMSAEELDAALEIDNNV